MRNLARDYRPLTMFVAGSLFALTVVGGVALAQNDIIEACVKDNGEMRIVDTAEDCKDNETSLSWNVTGPTGLQGPQGPEGPAGPPGPTGGLSGYEIVESHPATSDINPGQVGTVSAYCPEGKVVTGGGYSDHSASLQIISGYPVEGAWVVRAFQDSTVPGSIRVWAVCVDGE
jgi:hypothetical protein